MTDGEGRPRRAASLLRWLAFVAPVRARGELSIALASDDQVRALNRRYRGQDRPTDVLAFPARASKGKGERDKGKAGKNPAFANPEPRTPNPVPQRLGDIIIATGVAKRQAAEARHSYAVELRVLALHGLLHLLGYDHHDPVDRAQMTKVEARLRRKGGLTAGLIERAR